MILKTTGTARQRSAAKEESREAFYLILIVVFSFLGNRGNTQELLFQQQAPEWPSLLISPVPGAPLICGKTAATGQPPEQKPEAEPLLRGIIVGKDDRDTLDNVAVEVFLLDQEGQMQRVFTGLARRGSFVIPLPPESTHLLILRKAGYESEAFLVEAEEKQGERLFTLGGKESESGGENWLAGITENHPRALFTSTAPVYAFDLSDVRAESARMLAMMAKPERPEELTERGQGLPAVETPSEDQAIGLFTLTGATSFRREATHESEVLLRFQAGDKVEVLGKTNSWWWRIRFGNRTGYVKARMLRPAE